MSFSVLAVVPAACTPGPGSLTVGGRLIESLTQWVQYLGVPVAVLVFIVCVIGYFATKSTSPHNSGKFLGGILLSAVAAALIVSAPTIVGQFACLSV